MLGFFSVFGLACVGLVTALFGYRATSAAGQWRDAEASVIAVTAGKPSEFAFTLSKSSGLPFQAKSRSGTVSFRVANKGKLLHEFKVCSIPVNTASLNACNGTGTKFLEPGESATLTITFGRRGTYEYLSGVPGQAARGMKGLIGVGVSLATATAQTTAPTTATTTTSTPSVGLTGAAAAGAAIWAAGGCINCHSVSEVETQSGGNITLSLNQTHSGGPFTNGPLTATQMQQLAAFLSS
jgi:uncharacterized cupredoxin-like copper-binding protein